VTALAVDRAHARFVVAVAGPADAPGTHLLVFAPATATPLLRHIDAGLSACTAVALLPAPPPAVDLLVRAQADGDGPRQARLFRLRSHAREGNAPVPRAALEDARASGLLSALYGTGVVDAAPPPPAPAALAAMVTNPTTLPAVLDAPPHTLPRIERLYLPFMEQLLVRRAAAPTADADTDTGADLALATLATREEDVPAAAAAPMPAWLTAEVNPFAFVAEAPAAPVQA
jgi:hypothetical protein